MTTDAYAAERCGRADQGSVQAVQATQVDAETVDRFSDAGHADALPTLMEVLEQAAEDRRIRRVDRLRRASKLPAGKTWDTFEHERAPVKLSSSSSACRRRLRGQGRQRACVRYAGHRQDARDVRHRAQAGAGRTLCAVHPGVQARAGYAGGQARPRSAADAQEAGHYDLLVIDDLGYLPQGARRVGGAVHSDSRALRAPLARHHVQPGLLASGRRCSPTRWRQPPR